MEVWGFVTYLSFQYFLNNLLLMLAAILNHIYKERKYVIINIMTVLPVTHPF